MASKSSNKASRQSIPERPEPTSGKLPSDNILIGWSLEERPRRQIGFTSPSETFNKEKGAGLDPILHGREGHLMTIAPTGTGKGTGCVIPVLLQYGGPVIVIDPKGENYEVTSRYRRETLEQKIIRLDPMEVVRKASDGLNPLDLINPESPDAADEAAMIASILLPEHPGDRNRWWVRRARQLVSALILHVVTDLPESERNLSTIRRLLNLGTDQYPDLVKKLSKSSHPDVRDSANILSNRAPETLGGVVLYAQECVEIIRGSVRGVTDHSTFSLDEITRGDPVSVYIVLPPEKLDSHGALLKLWISCFFAAITRRRGPPQSRTLFILDEAAQLGGMPQLRQAITLLRGYGVQTWSFWQDLAQLKYLYPHEWLSMLNNCHVLQAFGIPNMAAAQDMAALFGYEQPTVLADLDYDEMLLLRTGDPAKIARRPNYLTDTSFKGLYDQNPKHSDFVDVMPLPKRPQRSFRKKPKPSVAEEKPVPLEEHPLWTIPIRNAVGEVTSYFKLTGDELRASVEGSLQHKVLNEWPILPMVDGEWEVLDVSTAVERLVSVWPSVTQGTGLGVSGIDAVRCARLPFMEKLWLHEARCLKGQEFWGYLTFLEVDGECFHLDGSNSILNQLGHIKSFDITSEENALAFLCLYCGALSSGIGTYNIVDRIEQVALFDTISDEKLSEVQRALAPPVLTETSEDPNKAGTWKADVMLKYQQDLVRVNFSFDKSFVSMDGDEKLMTLEESTRIDIEQGIRREFFEDPRLHRDEVY